MLQGMPKPLPAMLRDPTILLRVSIQAEVIRRQNKLYVEILDVLHALISSEQEVSIRKIAAKLDVAHTTILALKVNYPKLFMLIRQYKMLRGCWKDKIKSDGKRVPAESIQKTDSFLWTQYTVAHAS